MSLLSPHHTDDVMLHLALSLVPAFDRPGDMSKLFADHVAAAIVIHMAGTYGGLRPKGGPHQGGLAPWQERRVKEMMAADLRGDMGLGALASACGLSVGHFARSFKKTTGTTAHKWLRASNRRRSSCSGAT
jgi:transcriptional regulator GlxA family with amidase domain